MIVSRREMIGFLVFVALIGLAVFYVVAHRQQLVEGPSQVSTASPSVGVDGRTADGGPLVGGTVALTPDGGPGVADPEQTTDEESIAAAALADVLAVSHGTGEVVGPDLFVEFRIERARARSQQLDLLREILAGDSLEEEARGKALALWLEITENVGFEVDLENLIRAKGFADAVVVLGNAKATIMVKAVSLTPEEVLRVADLAVRIAGLDFEDITVMARGG